MDVEAIIKELIEERDLVDRAIASVEKIAAQHGKRRGRPPAWMTLLEGRGTVGPKRRGRRPGKSR